MVSWCLFLFRTFVGFWNYQNVCSVVSSHAFKWSG